MNVLDRFLRYVSFDTQSDEDSPSCPSTRKQLALGEALREELTRLGLSQVRLTQEGYVYARLPASPGCEDRLGIGFISHLDTSPSYPGKDVHPRIVDYTGGDLPLDPEGRFVIRAAEDEGLRSCQGKRLVVTDGSTLLGADDKAGIAEIVTALEVLLTHPDIVHGPVAVGFTPDEEIGRGADLFDVAGFGVPAAYTVDGGELGQIEYENFNAAKAQVLVHGFNVHPGTAKDKMKNALLIAMEFNSLLPPAETPVHTQGYEGFYHLCSMEGDESRASLSYILRDHRMDLFQARKDTIERCAAFLNARYGDGTVEVSLQDQYYNMRSMIEPHMELIHRAKDAFRKVGVTPVETPIRGGTDGARLSYEGLPCPNLSTGGFNFHGGHEFIPVESLEKMVEVLVELARQ